MTLVITKKQISIMLKNSHIIGWIGKETNGNDTEGNCRFYINARWLFLIMVVVYLGLRNFMKSKVGNALISIAAGAAVYFFLNDPTRVFDAFGKIIEKLFMD